MLEEDHLTVVLKADLFEAEKERKLKRLANGIAKHP